MKINEPRDHFKHQRDTFGMFIPENDEDWAAARTQCIGGSDIPTVMGRWGRERFNELLEEKRTGVQFFTGNLHTWVGKEMEGAIFKRFHDGEYDNPGDAPGAEVVQWNRVNAIRFDEKDRRFSCTPDIEMFNKVKPLVDDTIAVVNMKFTGKWLKSMPSDEMRMQVNWEMMVTGCETGGIFALHLGYGGDENPSYLRYFPIERDEKLIAEMRRAARIFMDGVASGADGAEIASEIGIEWLASGNMKGHSAKKKGGGNVSRDF